MRVVAAIVENLRGEVLLAQRPPGKMLAGLWEFPGGKIEPGESEKDAIARELQEELRLSTEITQDLGTFSYQYDWGRIELTVFVVRAINEPQVTEDVRVFRWTKPTEIDLEYLAEADVKPLEVYLCGT